MELELILAALEPFELSHLGIFLHCMEWSLCDQLLLQFPWIFLKPKMIVVDIMKTCKWVFDGARINFNRITAFQT